MDTQDFSDNRLQEPSGTQLEIAHQRLLTYLKALHIPVRTRYELAARSLALAEADGTPDADFIAAAMGNLEKILTESGASGFPKEFASFEPMPQLNRGAMIPVIMDRSDPFTFFFTIFITAVKRLLSPPVRLYFLLLLLAAAVGLYWWLDKA
jgi:hypothetical protein